MQSHLIVLIHGIRTRRTSPSWPKHFTGWVAGLPQVRTEAIYYEAGPLPIWNNVFKNPRLARELVSRIETQRIYQHGQRIHLVAHSNGGVIALATMKRLAHLGIPVDTCILTGAAVESDVEKSGLADLIGGGHLGRAIAYSSPDDGVIRRELEWIPGFYGSLGSKGFHRWGEPTGLRIEGYQPIGLEWGTDKHRYVTRMFTGYGHSDYFIETYRPATFACVARDLRLAIHDDRECPRCGQPMDNQFMNVCKPCSLEIVRKDRGGLEI